METNSHLSLYRSLGGPRSTRLIEIQPGDLNDDISCSLFPANIDDNRPYFALSYVWGDPTKTQPVKCNGTTFHATENLAAVMRKLRSGYQGKVFWIDTICIYQKDLQERHSKSSSCATFIDLPKMSSYTLVSRAMAFQER